MTTRMGGRQPTVTVEAFSLEGGRALWASRYHHYTGIAAAGGGRVFLNQTECIRGCEGEGYGFYRGSVMAVDAATGGVIWRRNGNAVRGPTLWQAGALANGLLFVERCELGRSRLGVLDASTGRLRWAVTFGPRDVVGGIDVVANGAVFGGFRSGRRGGSIVRFAVPGALLAGRSEG